MENKIQKNKKSFSFFVLRKRGSEIGAKHFFPQNGTILNLLENGHEITRR